MAKANDWMLKADLDHKTAEVEKRREAWRKTRRRGKALFV